ncbi:hypothetical protein GCM10018785_64390 [Streptomyces longispororuber]|uniref:Uncharacterized protein n=1 Tax=Streptomyces longispororuber TaxID=68230 RepID=A0A919A6K2_9ACTN|nr:hypothetical protein GCM10018785_64390 [Streptomyces longispororuber]
MTPPPIRSITSANQYRVRGNRPARRARPVRRTRRTRRTLGGLALALAGVLGLTQCGSPDADRERPAASAEHPPRERPTRAPSPSVPDSRPTDADGSDEEDLLRLVADYTSDFAEGRGYRRPSYRERRTVADGVALLVDRERRRAERRLNDVDFEVRTITDAATGRRYAEVADRTDHAAAPRGWGRVYVDLDSRVRWTAQVPHPVADRDTEQLGAQLMRRAPGGVLIIAGAHRKSGSGDEADVAHRRNSVFHAICDELAARGLPGIQIHGMADDSAPDHDVVASTGKGREALTEGRDLADALRRRGYEVCRAWARSCPLEGRKNVQGRNATAQDTEFLHVEFAPKMREQRKHRRAAVAALAEVTRDWRRSRS